MSEWEVQQLPVQQVEAAAPLNGCVNSSLLSLSCLCLYICTICSTDSAVTLSAICECVRAAQPVKHTPHVRLCIKNNLYLYQIHKGMAEKAAWIL